MVSIIVPVYNAGRYVVEAIQMVRAQTMGDWELILVDDCSSDDSVTLIKSDLLKMNDDERDRIHLICKLKNQGAASARNTGLDHANGRYIAFLDADDRWLPDKLEKEIAYMKERSAAFVFTAYEFGDEMAKGTGKVVAVPQHLTYKQALSRTVIFTSTVLIDRTKIDNELIKMPLVASEDTATWWRIMRAGYVAHGLNEVTTIYRRPPNSLSANKLTAMKRIWHLYRQEEGLSFVYSAYCFIMWAVRATLRRL
ncbi:MAG: glycosyltransferase family 2 protein [Lachnospiraceae bacterium]|nr:glycosyltransferase family 2 protein [Lachnospiraceae bacterium]